MAQYAPLPSVELDPRNEAALVQEAAQRVYEASGATINDFSSGSPIVALLEGQAFAQGEFLSFANQFPESVLIEWIGPFLGAQRRQGTGALVDLEITISPRDDQFDVFAGFAVSTSSNLTAGTKIQFVTTERLVIPPGETVGTVRAISVFRGTEANVAADTIISIDTNLQGIRTVRNPLPATGGTDVELISEVKERFFSLIRRRNPTSSEDWTSFFSDALGEGAAVAVLPRRSEKGVYRYEEDYVTTNPSVAFFVLNPDGTPITKLQQDALSNLLKWSLPTEFLGYVYPMEVDDADFVLDVLYDPAKPYAQIPTDFTRTIRDNLFGVMRPNQVFPITYDRSVNDVTSALTETFPLTLGTANQYVDPDISSIRAYCPPTGISVSEFKQVRTSPYRVGDTVQTGDLLVQLGNVNNQYFEVEVPFNPVPNNQSYYVNTGFLQVELIIALASGSYQIGDVIGDNGALFVVIEPFDYNNETISQLEAKGFVKATIPVDWDLGIDYTVTNDLDQYAPDLIFYTNEDTPFNVSWPTAPAAAAKNVRPGAPIYVVTKDFTLEVDTTKFSNVWSQGLVNKTPITIELLEANVTYDVGTYVKTPTPNDLASDGITQENCYLSAEAGALEIVAQVQTQFTFVIPALGNYTSAVNTLIEENTIDPVQQIPFEDCNGQAIFTAKPFRYQARFFAGEYVRYRPEGGFDAAELEACVKQNEECGSVTEPCKKLLKQRLPLPSYYFVLKDFTPNTDNVSSLLAEESIQEVSPAVFTSTYVVELLSTTPVSDYNITTAVVAAYPGVDSSQDFVNGETTVLVLDEQGTTRGVYAWNSQWIYQAPGLPTFRDIFRFAPGDIASFRSVSQVRNYEATRHVTPILDLEVYFDAGIFKSTANSATVSYYDALYHYEDVTYTMLRGSQSYYRTIHSFTPPETVVTDYSEVIVANTPRVEEIQGNLLKFVELKDCNQIMSSRLRDNASTLKLGACQLNIRSKSVGSATTTYVWEPTANADEASVLSYYPGKTLLPPVNYGTGTLHL